MRKGWWLTTDARGEAKRVARLCDLRPATLAIVQGFFFWFLHFTPQNQRPRFAFFFVLFVQFFSSQYLFFPFFFPTLSRFSVFVLLRWTLAGQQTACLPTPPAFPFIFFPSSLFPFLSFSFPLLFIFSIFLYFPSSPSHLSTPPIVHSRLHSVLCNFFFPNPPGNFYNSFPSSLEFNLTELRLCCILLRYPPNIPSPLRDYNLMARDKAGPPWSDAEKVSHTDLYSISCFTVFLFRCCSANVSPPSPPHGLGMLTIDFLLYLPQIQLLLEIVNQVNSDPNWKGINVPGGL